jgi:hypothetical protein
MTTEESSVGILFQISMLSENGKKVNVQFPNALIRTTMVVWCPETTSSGHKLKYQKYFWPH